jgi:Ribosomal protein L6
MSRVSWEPCAGQLTRDFKHTRLDFAIVEEDGVKKLRVDCHLGKRKSLAVMRTVTSHIQNLFTGVSKVRLCCARAVVPCTAAAGRGCTFTNIAFLHVQAD